MIFLPPAEARAVERIHTAPILARTEAWVAINSGTRNLAGLATMAGALADAFAVLPGHLALIEPAPVEAVGADGSLRLLDHGRHLHLAVRPEAPVQVLLTGHMDTVYDADHAFQTGRWLDDGTLNAPGATDMKGGLALMLAALEAVETSPLAARWAMRC